MHKTKLHFVVARALPLVLLFSSLLQPVGAQELAPGVFGKTTPIDLTAYISVWSMTLDWGDSSGATEYEYCFDKTDDDTCGSSWISTGTDTSVQIGNLDATTTYYWQVRAFDGADYTEADGGTWWSFTTGAHARFHVQLVENNVLGIDWRPGDSVTVTIDDPSNGVGVDFTDTKTVDSNGMVVFYGLDGLQLGTGMVVTMTDGVVFKSHTVINLQVTGVNVATDVISGTGQVGANIQVQHCQYNGCLWRRWTTIQPDGTWQVDFSVVGPGSDEKQLLDIVPGTSAEALYPDPDADHTDVDIYMNQKFVAYPEEERVDGTGWVLSATVTVEINDPGTLTTPDYTGTMTVTQAPWDASRTWFNIDFNGQYDLQSGDVVTVTDGTTTKVHTVTSVQITKVDPATDVISGTAAPYSFVDLQTCEAGGCTYRTELADSNGNWAADFSVAGDQAWEQTVFDIVSTTTGDARQWDDDVESTMIQWSVRYVVFLPLIVRD